jgi:hypothetical protein
MHVTILCAHWTFQFHGSCTTHCLKCWLCIPIWALCPRNDFFQKLLSNITIIICSQPFCIPCQSLQRKRKSGSLRTEYGRFHTIAASQHKDNKRVFGEKEPSTSWIKTKEECQTQMSNMFQIQVWQEAAENDTVVFGANLDQMYSTSLSV